MPANKKKIFLGAAVFFIALIPLFPRDVEITVEDTELGLPLEGALVRSWDGAEYTADEEGRVIITVPDDRQVVIRAAYPGYENGRLIIPAAGERFSLGLRLSGVMEHRELVIEAARPETGETKTGRSIAISGEEIGRTAEIGIIEDVMTAIKTLPGVGYSGMFNAMPSIRGGEPQDLLASLDGFYIENPYHWGGGFSIFDPRMVESAKLSHGVFSSRYGHSISGLLEIRSKKASPTETELELGVSTSVTNLNLSLPLFGRGGVMIMGKVTYYDPFVWAAKQAARIYKDIEIIKSVETAPYIRSVTVSANYRIDGDLELSGSGFFGADGVGVHYNDDYLSSGLSLTVGELLFEWTNYLGFLTAGAVWNPLNSMVLKAQGGLGYQQYDMTADMVYDLRLPYSDDFYDKYGPGGPFDTGEISALFYTIDFRDKLFSSDSVFNIQGRVDYDWDLGRGFLFAAGLQELHSQWVKDEDYRVRMEHPVGGRYVNYPLEYTVDADNRGYTSSAYTLLEYTGPKKFFGAELGLRLDHFYFAGRDYSIQTYPALNPRLNLDFSVLKNRGPLDEMVLTLGTGLFSSMNDTIGFLQGKNKIGNFDLRPARSWTSVLGTRMEFAEGFEFNLEGYYKYVFDRTHAFIETDYNTGTASSHYRFDGMGHIGGFDLILQKKGAGYFDGWVSYSFNYARYRGTDALSSYDIEAADRENIWYYPYFHRFHVLNLILNIRPVSRINIGIRFGFASGRPISKPDGAPRSYPVEVLDPGQGSKIIEKWHQTYRYDDHSRTTWSFPLDIKISFLQFKNGGKARSEVYFAIENLLALAVPVRGNVQYNEYTGRETTGSLTASYDIPIPVPSFGFKWSY
ncbi:MAG: TonB-dependent receptor plug domain-containing protein [Treponema sp.]|nr:TonB-dependent receptor plug domain-containing protein [Treponema sp.]